MKLDNVFGIHEQALQVWSQRNELLASNIANADTPNYKARDIDFRAVLQQETAQVKPKNASSGAMPDNARHIRFGEALSKPKSAGGYVQFRDAVQASEDGNTVDIHNEQMEYAKNLAYFEATMNFLNGKIKGIEQALGKG